MKIAYIALKGMPLGGGIEKYTEEIGSRLAERGHKIIAYVMRHYGACDGTYRGIDVKTVPTVKSRSLEKVIASFVATLKQCVERDVDIVHFHAFGPAMFSVIPRFLGRKVVVQGHGIEWKRSRWGPAARLFLRASEVPSVRFPHVLTVVSDVQKKYLRDRYGKESIRIPTGVNRPSKNAPDLIRRFGLSGDDYILFAARLVREKGAHFLIDAYRRSKNGVKLVIAGDAQHEEGYKAELLRLAGGDEDIVFTGFATGKLLQELFSNCRLFVQPSEIEGLPIGLLEAMSYGNCCLASDIPENIEAMNGHGYVFKNGNVEDLAAKLSWLKSDPVAVASVKEGARDYVIANHSWDSIAGKFEEMYTSMLNGNGGLERGIEPVCQYHRDLQVQCQVPHVQHLEVSDRPPERDWPGDL